LSTAPHSPAQMYLYKIITVSVTVILLGDVTVRTRPSEGFYPSFHAVHMHASLCGSMGLQSVEMSTYQTWGWTVIFTRYTHVVNPTPPPPLLYTVYNMTVCLPLCSASSTLLSPRLLCLCWGSHFVFVSQWKPLTVSILEGNLLLYFVFVFIL